MRLMLVLLAALSLAVGTLPPPSAAHAECVRGDRLPVDCGLDSIGGGE